MDFSGDPEEVGERQTKFLAVFLPMAKNSVKDVERKAFQEAGGHRVSKHIVETCVSKCRAVRQVVLRKNRNSKTGQNMPEWCKQLLLAILPSQAVSAPKAVAKPKALPVVMATPVASEPGLEEAMSPATPEILPTQESVVTVPSSVASSPVVALALPVEGTPLKKPAAVVKRPACLKVKATRATSTWVQSASFGEMKLTVAKAKSYIQARDTSDAKQYCLVNIQGDGVDHGSIAKRVMTYAQGAGLNKAQVVDYKNKLL
eukprot:Skav212624  [mRNA]  locus=scaffold173:135056:135832:- [translate_table: standard]